MRAGAVALAASLRGRVKQVLLKQGGVVVAEVPAPQVEPGSVLVRTAYSCVSVGTEMSGVRASNVPLWKRALERPDQIRRVIRMVATDGLARTRDTVQSRLALASPIGYSLAGTVIGIGKDIDDIALGERVACAGAQSAHHAEIVCVPRNLVVPVPDELDLAHASTVTLGAIALQGVRRASPTLGETFVVVGLGILGQIVVQLLKANGLRVIGIDPDRDRIAMAAGLDIGLHPDDASADQQVPRLTGGVGADGVIITAASQSHQILSGAFRMCRRKGRVVLIGDVGLNIDRADIYAKELDFLVSTSYGPGRYDRNYEERGLDYPVGYVRWTENRNMQAYLNAVAEGQVRLSGLLDVRYPVEEAPTAYAALASDERRPMTVLLTYPETSVDAVPVRRVSNISAAPGRGGALRVALVGAGGFAKGTHLPILRAHPEAFHLRAVCTRQGHNATTVATQYGAGFSTTDYADILADDQIDAVIIATRHDRHGDMVLQALKAGKHVFVEKPLCLTESELSAIEEFCEQRGDRAPIVLTGFNRRFSRYAQAIIAASVARSNPLVMTYRVNAGHIPADHWVHGVEGGGRNLGEACHFYDLFIALANAMPEAVSATSIRHASGYYRADDNFCTTIRFADGSLANLVYTALGAESFPKERLDVFFDGKVYAIDNFTRLEVHGASGPQIATSNPAKGHEEELVAFARAIQTGGPWPIPLWQQAAATRIALQVQSQLG